MPDQPLIYDIQCPLEGRPGEYYTVVRALSPEGAADCVRVILQQRDRRLTEVKVVVGVQI